MIVKNLLRSIKQTKNSVLPKLNRACFTNPTKKDEDYGTSNLSDEQAKRKMEEEIMRKGNKDYSKIKLDKESIKKKLNMQRETKLPLDHYNMKKPGQFYDSKTNQNPTTDVFNFSEEVLLKKEKY